MPKHKADATEFTTSVVQDTQRIWATIPKVLYEKLNNRKQIKGFFTLTKGKLTLKILEE